MKTETLQSNPARSQPFAKWRVPAVCLALAVAVFAVFGQAIGFDFVNYDDNVYVYENPMVAGGLNARGIEWAFTHADCQLYHPLTILSLMADHQLHGLRAGGYHLTNILLHAAAAILLFLALRSMTGALWPSAFVAAIFAIHPLRAESVAWVSERKDVLAGFFFSLTLAAYARFARNPKSWARYGLVLLAFAAAALSKPTVVTAPFVLLLLDWWPLRRKESIRRLLLEKVPMLALSAAAAVATMLAARQAIAEESAVSLSARVANAAVSCVVYLKQLFWPVGLAAYYPPPPHGQPASLVLLSLLLLAGITVVAFIFARTHRWLLTGWLWYLGMLVPMIGLVQAGSFAHADRVTYLPEIGICLGLAWEISRWKVGRAAVVFLAGGLVVLLGAAGFVQTSVWQNSETLWTYTLACTTDNVVADHNYGLVLMKKGRLNDAIDYFNRAISLKPDMAEARDNLGEALLRMGQVDNAIAQGELAIQFKPSDAKAQGNLGNAYFLKGRLEDAAARFRQALSLDPSMAMARNDLGAVLLRQNHVDEAVGEFQKALQQNPQLAEAHFNLGNAFDTEGKTQEAILQFQQAAQIDPNDSKFKQRLDQMKISHPPARPARP